MKDSKLKTSDSHEKKQMETERARAIQDERQKKMGLYKNSHESSFESDNKIKRNMIERGELPIVDTPLPEKKDFNYWNSRFIKRQETVQETEQVKNHVEFTFPRSICLNFIGDLHVGSPMVDYRRIQEEAETIVDTPNSYVMMMGDLIDGFFFNPAQMDQMEQTPEQIEYMKAILKYYADYGRLLIGWSGDHDCLDKETQALTRRGWLSYDQLKDGDEVLSFDAKTKKAVWTKFSHIIIDDFDGELYHTKTKAIDLMATGKHRHFYKERGKDNFKFDNVKNIVLKHNDNKEFVLAGDNGNAEYPISDNELSLLGWLITDGGIKKKAIIFYQSKPVGVRKLRNLLSGYDYKENTRHRTRDSIAGMVVGKLLPSKEFKLTVEESKRLLELCPDKKIPEFTKELSKRQFDVFLNSLLDGDGSRRGKALMFYQHNKETVDTLQALCVANGYRTSIYVYENREGSKQFRLNIYPKKYSRIGSYKDNTRMVKYNDKIWDLTVPKYHNFMVRRGGKAFFTGNSWCKKYGANAYADFSSYTGAHLMSGIGYATLNVGEQQYKITGCHRLPGNSIYNKNHPGKRSLIFGGSRGSDIVVSAHTHGKAHTEDSLTGFGGVAEDVHIINIGPYKWNDGYAQKLGLTPISNSVGQMYGSSVILNGEMKDIHYYNDIIKANKILAERYNEQEGTTSI